MSTTIDSSFLNYTATKPPTKSSNGLGGSGGGVTTSTNAFQSTVTATISSINLDRTIYEEAKPSRHNEPATTTNTSTPSLSNLLSQPIGSDLLGNDLLGSGGMSATATVAGTIIDSEVSHQIDGEKSNETEKYNQQYQQYVQQQQTLNQWSSSVNPTSQIAQLTAQITTPPALFIYIVDPFDYYLYNSRLRNRRVGKTSDDSDLDDDQEDESSSDGAGVRLTECDLKRLRTLGLMKAYLEFYNNVPDLFKYSCQFQVVPLALCLDLQHHSTSMYLQATNNSNASTSAAKSSSSLVSRRCMKASSCAASNYSSYYAAGFGTGWSDLDGDFKLSALKNQAFSVFALSKRQVMSPAFNYYLNTHQQQNNPLRPKTLTGFGPAACEDKFLKENFVSSIIVGVRNYYKSFKT